MEFKLNNDKQPEMQHPEFWAFMERNSEYVRQMPDWVKGSRLNEREPIPVETLSATRVDPPQQE